MLNTKDARLLLPGTFVVTLDFFAISVLLAPIGRDLGASNAALQWLVAGFGLVYGSTLVIGAELGARYGAVRVYRYGCLLFGLAAAMCAVADSVGTLAAVRALQGAGAAALSPQVVARLASAAPAERARGFAAYSAALGLGSGVGQLLAGATLSVGWGSGSWRVSFALVALFSAIAAFAAWRFDESSSQPPAVKPPADVASAALLVLSVAAVLFPLVEGRHLGWPASMLWVALAGVAGTVAFWQRQRRRLARGCLPLIDPRIFDAPGVGTALFAVFAFYCGVASFFMVLSVHLQTTRALMPMAAAAVFSTMVAGFLLATFKPNWGRTWLGSKPLTAGAWCLVGCHLALAVIGAIGAPLAILLPALFACGWALGVLMAPLIAHATGKVPPPFASAASGLVATAQWLGNAVGAAAVGSLYFARSTKAEGLLSAIAAAHLAYALIAVGVATLITCIERSHADPRST
jgi:MFS family permease